MRYILRVGTLRSPLLLLPWLLPTDSACTLLNLLDVEFAAAAGRRKLDQHHLCAALDRAGRLLGRKQVANIELDPVLGIVNVSTSNAVLLTVGVF